MKRLRRMRPLRNDTRILVLSLHDGAIKRDSSSKKVQPLRNRRALQFALNDPRIMVTADFPSVINGLAGESIEEIEWKRRRLPFFRSMRNRVQWLGLFSMEKLKGLIYIVIHECNSSLEIRLYLRLISL